MSTCAMKDCLATNFIQFLHEAIRFLERDTCAKIHPKVGQDGGGPKFYIFFQSDELEGW